MGLVIDEAEGTDVQVKEPGKHELDRPMGGESRDVMHDGDGRPPGGDLDEEWVAKYVRWVRSRRCSVRISWSDGWDLSDINTDIKTLKNNLSDIHIWQIKFKRQIKIDIFIRHQQDT